MENGPLWTWPVSNNGPPEPSHVIGNGQFPIASFSRIFFEFFFLMPSFKMSTVSEQFQRDDENPHNPTNWVRASAKACSTPSHYYCNTIFCRGNAFIFAWWWLTLKKKVFGEGNKIDCGTKSLDEGVCVRGMRGHKQGGSRTTQKAIRPSVGVENEWRRPEHHGWRHKNTLHAAAEVNGWWRRWFLSHGEHAERS